MSHLDSNDVEITTTWDIEGGKSLRGTLTVSPSNAEYTLENVVKYETCVHLIGKDHSPCEMQIKSSATHGVQMTQIAIVSEAEIIELYGKCGEYLTTTHADFIDDFEDMAVYMAVLQLPKHATDCCVKFVKAKNKGQLWVYGINVLLENCQPLAKENSSVNFDNVNKILQESGHQLTEKAEKCKRFLQLFDSSRLPSKPPDPQTLVKMFESAYLPQGHPFGEQAKNMSKCLTDLWPGFALSTKAKTVGAQQELGHCGGDLSASSSLLGDNLKRHIDQCFSTLEERLLNKVDEKLKEIENKQNVKFNLILMKLEELQRTPKIPDNTN